MVIEDARLRRLKDYYRDEVPSRAGRPLSEQRIGRLAAFVANCNDRRLHSVIEIGAGVGRDGQVIAEQGFAYTGVDLTPASVKQCRALGLEAVVASATDIPFRTGTFDACWTMSTLMHLTEAELELALDEIHRVVRPGGVVEVGVWGHTAGLERTDEHGRFFRQLSDDELVASLGRIGNVVAFDTWAHRPDGGHFQWARIAR
jgi:SAM-dependent methyltransferase